uniref:Reverse transcriptase Ty1/copia-type domain-containing protein n=1 Tax=Ananas comosus var. bracteatus TaxID=296719 RepID=A0A6V7NF39_ANACO|nr:unnamed protein product [Ananas comosus var. bracteatus]
MLFRFLWRQYIDSFVVCFNLVDRGSALYAHASGFDEGTGCDEVQVEQAQQDKVVDEVVDKKPDSESPHSVEDASSREEQPTDSGHPRKVTRPPMMYNDYITSLISSADHVSVYVALMKEDEPTSYKEALQSTKAGNWQYAIEEKIGVMKNADRNVKRFKARLLMKGYAQKLKIDFDEIFLPVAHLITIRVVLAIAAVKPEQIDMRTAFLHGDLKEEIYMSQCEGFVEKGKQDLVCLYGLKRAPRFARNSKGRISTLKTQFVEEFDMKALRVVNQILRIKMLWDRKEEYLAFTKGLCGEGFRRFNIRDQN